MVMAIQYTYCVTFTNSRLFVQVPADHPMQRV
jgi:hypothetical protein